MASKLMEIIMSAILGDLTTRCIGFLASNSNRPNKPQPAPDTVEDRLRRVLLRAQVIIDEAMGRQITNQAMLQQLDALTDTVHRGYYTLDAFRSCHWQDEQEKEEASSNGQKIVSHQLSSLFSRVDPCLTSWTRAVQISEEMQEVVDSLSAMIVDAHEFVLFLGNYGRRMYRQPYSMHLQLGNSMFDRQMEAQYVIDFLLHTHQPPGVKEPEILPIVGPCRVGKSTLVAHVCEDERVRDHFAETVFLSDHDFAYDGLAAFREGLSAKNRKPSDHGTTRRMLLVVEVTDIDLDEDVWNRLYTASKHWMPMGSKIILTSRSDKVVKLGTIQALTLKPLSREAYWYFFRTLAFGTEDPMKSHPRLVNLAMETAVALNGCMVFANVVARMMRDSFDAHCWSQLAAFMRLHFQKHLSKFGEHPYYLMDQNKPVYFSRIHRRSEQVVCYHQYRHSSQKEVPQITMHDVTNGDAKLPAGRFDVLAWRSRIPPYYSYIYACEIQEHKSSIGNKRKRSTCEIQEQKSSTGNKRKRCAKNRGTLL